MKRIKNAQVIIRRRGLKEGRPTQFGSVKVICSIRIPKDLKAKIKTKYGSVQRWIDGHIKKEIRG